MIDKNILKLQHQNMDQVNNVSILLKSTIF